MFCNQPYQPHQPTTPSVIPKPEILATGICATSPQLPCCKEAISSYNMLNGPYEIADLGLPACRPDGYYAAKQCHFGGCYCVDENGTDAGGVRRQGNYDIECSGRACGVKQQSIISRQVHLKFQRSST